MLRISNDPAPTTVENDDTVAISDNANVFDNAAGQPMTATPPTASSIEDHIPENHGRMLVEWLSEEIRFHTAIDLGCGDGTVVDVLNEASYEAWGIDLNAETDESRRVYGGDMFDIEVDDGYFDVVTCTNVMQSIENHRIPLLLAEIDRLSNSYVLLSFPSGEKEQYNEGIERSLAWWMERIGDLGWRIRMLREDPYIGQLAILAEKRDSLAAQVLPLLETEQEIVDGPTNQPDMNARLDETTSHFRAGNTEDGFRALARLAEQLIDSDIKSRPGATDLFHRIVEAMKQQNAVQIVYLLENELKPLL